MFPTPKFICDDTTKKWGLWNVIRMRRGHKGAALMNGASALVGVPGRPCFSLLSTVWGCEKATPYNLEETSLELNHAAALILKSPAFRTMWHKPLLFISHSVYSPLLYSSSNLLRAQVSLEWRSRRHGQRGKRAGSRPRRLWSCWRLRLLLSDRRHRSVFIRGMTYLTYSSRIPLTTVLKIN